MAAFSSRGPAGDFVKPDVVAPGVQVLAAKSPEPVETFGGPPGELFQAIAGTSMAAPALDRRRGAAAGGAPGLDGRADQVGADDLVGDRRRCKQDGTTPAGPFDMGAGRIRADKAANPTLTFDVPAQTYVDEIGDTPHLDRPEPAERERAGRPRDRDHHPNRAGT